jgi:hypothetical protein
MGHPILLRAERMGQKQQQIPFGDDNQKNNDYCKDNENNPCGSF